MGARRFSPDVGRFMQRDQYLGALSNLGLGSDPLTQNRYSLAGGNPLSFIESDGHRPVADGRGTAGAAVSGGGGDTSPNFQVMDRNASSGGGGGNAGGGGGGGGVDGGRWRQAVQAYEAEHNVASFDSGLASFCYSTPGSAAQARQWAPACLGANSRASLPSFEEEFQDIAGGYYTKGYRPPTEVESLVAAELLTTVIGGPLFKLAARGASWAWRGLRGATTAGASGVDNVASQAARRVPSTEFGKAIESFESGEVAWKRIGFHIEASDSYRNAYSVQEAFRFQDQWLVRHRIYDADTWEVLQRTYRPFGK